MRQFYCNLCGDKITQKKPMVWIGIPTYCVLCWYFTERPKVIEQMQKEGYLDKHGNWVKE